MDRMMAELFGRVTGYCKGKGGSMHIADFSCGMLGANGIVGANLGIAAGAALAITVRGTDQVAVAFFGDGAVTRGTFHEVVNLTALWKLPVLFICENNQYAQWMHQRENIAIQHISALAAGYGIPGSTVDGNDVFAVRKATSEAVDRARRGDGPTLFECKTYRIYGHTLGDQQVYRQKAEVEEWKKRDPILRFEETLRAAGLPLEEWKELLLKEIEAEVEFAVEFALKSPFPEASELTSDVSAR
jgi:pyruvate dehydrogenase E1 component alpha subunit